MTGNPKAHAVREAMTRAARDPVYFVRLLFGAEPSEQQAAILDVIVEPGAHVSVRSGHGTGKSTTLAWLMLWFLTFNDNSRIPCTAPTAHQLFDVLWPEIKKWHAKMPPAMRRLIQIGADRIVYTGKGSDRFAVARTARKESPEALQGFHAENLLFVVEEASGVPQEIFEVAEGALSTPGARVIMIGNPTRTEGYFYDSHHKMRSEWRTFHLSCLDSPHVDPSYPATMERKYGKDSDVYRVRVLGEFPKASADALIPLGDLEAAVGREIKQSSETLRVCGVDVARYGDDASAVVVRQGNLITYAKDWYGLDTMETAGQVHELYKQKQFDVACVDVIGIGAGVYDRLKALKVPCAEVNVAEASAFSRKFHRLRDELWWRVREFFVEHLGGILPDAGAAQDLIAELSTQKYKIEPVSGKIKAWSKDEMKKEGLPSPNLADALCLTFSDHTVQRAKARRRGTSARAKRQWIA